MYQYKDSGIILKTGKERLMSVAKNSIGSIKTEKRQKLENRNGKKKYCIGVLSDILARLHTRWHGYSNEGNV